MIPLACSIPHIIEQHAEEAAFLWLLRNNAITEAHYNLEQLQELEERLEAHIDGLRIAEDTGYSLCIENLNQFKESGEMFAAAILTFESQNKERLEVLYRIAEENTEIVQGLISALGWIEPQHLQGKVSGMLASANPFLRRIGIAACAIHRVNPRKYLAAAIQNNDVALCCCALKAVGELAEHNFYKLVAPHLDSDDPDIQFWAAWSASLIGDRNHASQILYSILTQAKDHAEKAAQILFRSSSLQESQQYLSVLVKQYNHLRLAIQGSGISGDILYIPWLIQQMRTPEYAQVAGEAFSLITGVDLAYNDLEMDQPENFHAGPTESPDDDDVALDADENLPWPNANLVQQWWQQHQNDFTQGQRYLMGQVISESQCNAVLKTATQRQRYAAALELALMSPDQPLFETRSKASRQYQQLAEFVS